MATRRFNLVHQLELCADRVWLCGCGYLRLFKSTQSAGGDPDSKDGGGGGNSGGLVPAVSRMQYEYVFLCRGFVRVLLLQ